MNSDHEQSQPAAHLTELDWQIRLFIYRSIVDEGGAPSVDEMADAFAITPEAARQSIYRLERPHQIVLEPGTDRIRMAIPLSAVPTPHRVWIDGKRHYANCAWDSLGVAAMLRSDAEIEAPSPQGGEPIRYAIEDGRLDAPANLAISFPLPLKQWFENIVST